MDRAGFDISICSRGSLTILLLLAVSFAILTTELRSDATTGRELFALDALAPGSPLAPNSVDWAGRGVARLNLLELISGAIISAILRSLTFSRALLLSTSAGGGTLFPVSPWLPLSIDGAWSLVALFGYFIVSLTIPSAIEGPFAGASFLGESTCTCLGTVGPITPLAPDSVDGAVVGVAFLYFCAVTIALIPSKKGTVTLARSLLFTTTAFFAALAPGRPSKEDSINWTLAGATFRFLLGFALAFFSSEEGTVTFSLSVLDSATA